MALRKTLKEITMSLDSKLDTVHSIWTRLLAVDENGNGKCPLCGNGNMTFWTFVCGHFIKRRHTRTKWSKQNTDAICPDCNGLEESENTNLMRNYKVYKLGIEAVEEMERLIHIPFKMSRWDKETLLKTRRLQCRELLKEKNFSVQIP